MKLKKKQENAKTHCVVTMNLDGVDRPLGSVEVLMDIQRIVVLLLESMLEFEVQQPLEYN